MSIWSSVFLTKAVVRARNFDDHCALTWFAKSFLDFLDPLTNHTAVFTMECHLTISPSESRREKIYLLYMQIFISVTICLKIKT